MYDGLSGLTFGPAFFQLSDYYFNSVYLGGTEVCLHKKIYSGNRLDCSSMHKYYSLRVGWRNMCDVP